MFDVLIRHGTVVDGTGRPARKADVAIRGGRIADIGQLAEAQAKQVIDARERVVAPGFVDVHHHSDGWMLKNPAQPSKTAQGFSTEVLMADGISYAPVNRQTAREWLFYLRALDGLRMDEYRQWSSLQDFMEMLDGRTAQNTAMHVPYANVRSLASGFGRRSLDDFEMRTIRGEIRRGMQAGAVGLSTGLDYIVQCYASTEELIEACRVVAEFGGLYVTHVRYKLGLLEALQEAVTICRQSGARLHVSHLKAQSPEQAEQILTYIDQEARHDVDLSFDIYPYQPGSTMLSYLLPYEVWDDGPLSALGRLGDLAVRDHFARGLSEYRLDLEKIRIAWVGSTENKRLQGLRLRDYVDETRQSPEDALLDLLIEERCAVLLVFEEGDDRLGDPFLQHDLYMMGTDGILAADGYIHPRQYGSVGRLLGPLVRDRGL
ncbi:MAG: amidohydrolase family protein, partial [Planctomycetaceae bacterium]